MNPKTEPAFTAIRQDAITKLPSGARASEKIRSSSIRPRAQADVKERRAFYGFLATRNLSPTANL